MYWLIDYGELFWKGSTKNTFVGKSSEDSKNTKKSQETVKVEKVSTILFEFSAPYLRTVLKKVS